ncbi:hypothetical protein ACE6H2_026664 [Prunus campanulata]
MQVQTMPMIQKLLSLLFHIFLFSSLPLITTTSSSPTPRAQAEALIKWKRSFSSSSSPPPSLLHSCLTYLALASNKLNGELPLSLSNLNNINKLGLSGNLLTGPILPSLISNWTEVDSLQLQNIKFSGNIPGEIGLLTKLNYLFLDNNNFFGSIPSEIGNSKDLTGLALSGNQLSGPIPMTLWNLTNIKTVTLYSNNLTGMIPPEIENTISLEEFDANTNHLIPRNFGKYSPNLSILRLSHNIFTGELPPELCSGSSLEELSVAGNNFSGSLPKCLRNCSKLQTVAVDHNQFMGSITKSFGGIDFSYNNLTGPIPTGGALRKVPANAFVGNDGLCGDTEGLTPCNSNRGKSNKINKDLLDQRLRPPPGQSAAAVASVVTMALACTRTNAESRPTMDFVAKELLSARTQANLSIPFGMITIKYMPNGYLCHRYTLKRLLVAMGCGPDVARNLATSTTENHNNTNQ